ncbi:1-deoxy-D-xylulose-5-phosphate synthase [Hafnia alvei]|uniref:1-deoxy-D-xylulose-5-phosphate synthase n=1 Tax=Hafnia alvei TaxID=569 RepID=A0A377PLT3_HAFAL|nr:1-deoxy-D-xylulose-5-phosphate synthase [Hafnia alvei]
MSFDIAKYPTLALVEDPNDLRLLPKESLPKLWRRTSSVSAQ